MILTKLVIYKGRQDGFITGKKEVRRDRYKEMYTMHTWKIFNFLEDYWLLERRLC